MALSISEGDVRKEFLLTTIANYFSLPLRDESISQLSGNEKLNNFLDDGNANLLSANIEKRPDRESRIILDNATHVGHTEDKVKHNINLKKSMNYLTIKNVNPCNIYLIDVHYISGTSLFQSTTRCGHSGKFTLICVSLVHVGFSRFCIVSFLAKGLFAIVVERCEMES